MALPHLSAGDYMTLIHKLPMLCAAALAAVLSVLSLASPAFAEEASGGASGSAVSWSVSPADAGGADGRHSFEHEIEAGEEVGEYLVVRNLGERDVVFALTAADGFVTPSGRFDMLPSTQQSTDSGTWITLPQQVEVAAGSSAVVPFTISVPADAEPGDHAAGVAASVMSVGATGADGAGVGVESRVGVKVLTRVAGEITPSFTLDGVRAEYLGQANPFAPGALNVTFELQNTGNARMVGKGELAIAGQRVVFPAEGEQPQTLLPGGSHEFTVSVPEIWPTVFMAGDLSVTPEAASFGGDPVSVDPVTRPVSAWAVPWSQLLVLAGVGLLLVAIIGGRKRSRRRMDALISQAVERGREQALQEPNHQGPSGNSDVEPAGMFRAVRGEHK